MVMVSTAALADVNVPITGFPSGWTTIPDLRPPSATTGDGETLFVDNPWVYSTSGIGLLKSDVFFDSALDSPLLTFSSPSTAISFTYNLVDDDYGAEGVEVHLLKVSGNNISDEDYQTVFISGGTTIAQPHEADFSPTPGDTYQIRFRAFDGDTKPSIESLSLSDTISITNATLLLLPGDFNHNHQLDPSDVPLIMQALTNPAAYQAIYHDSDADLQTIGNVNGDASFDNADMQALLYAVEASSGAAISVPESSSFVLAVLGAFGSVLYLRAADRFRLEKSGFNDLNAS
jgi:hypothetical protein